MKKQLQDSKMKIAKLEAENEAQSAVEAKLTVKIERLEDLLDKIGEQVEVVTMSQQHQEEEMQAQVNEAEAEADVFRAKLDQALADARKNEAIQAQLSTQVQKLEADRRHRAHCDGHTPVPKSPLMQSTATAYQTPTGTLRFCC